MSEPAIVAESVTYTVGGTRILNGVDLEASWSELVGIIGPNGAGKSTLLSVLAGDLKPHEGTVSLNGNAVEGGMNETLALTRAVLSQRSRADIPFTVREVVSMGRFPHQRRPANTSEQDHLVVSTAMGRTDTAQYAGRVYSTLSGGEQARVSFARVLAQETPIVLLDEPTAALDIGHQERIMTLTVAMARQGKSVVVVLHDLNAAAAHCDRLVLMHEGSVVAAGSPATVLDAGVLTDIYRQPMAVVDHPLREGRLVLATPAR